MLVIVLAFLVSPPRPSSGAPDWPEWRGAARQGVLSSSSGPIHWGPDQGVVWRTSIPGGGHSSPIVSGDSVYVTTARPAPRSRLAAKGLRHVLQAGLLLLVAFTTHFIVVVSRQRSGEVARGASLWRLVAFGVGVGVLCAGVLFAEELVDFDRSPVRAWSSGTLCGTLALLLTVGRASRQRRWCLASGLLLWVLAAAAYAWMPDREVSFRFAGMDAANAFAVVILSIPSLAGLSVLIRGLCSGRSPAPPVAAYLTAAASTGLVTVGLVVVALREHRKWAVACGDLAPSNTVPTWLWGAGLAWLGLSLVFSLIRRGRPDSWALSLVWVLAAVPTAMLALATTAVLLVSRSEYLSFELGLLHLERLLTWRSVQLLPVVSVGSLLLSVVSASRQQDAAPATLSLGFRATALVVAATYFAFCRANPGPPSLIRSVVCVDAMSGDIVWGSRGPTSQANKGHPDNSQATPTPATDGKRVYAYFGDMGVLCVGGRGRVQWLSRELPFYTMHGAASSPILCQRKLVVLSESAAGRWLCALNCQTGQVVWKVSRDFPIHQAAGNCRTPAVWSVAGRETLVVWGYEDLTGYDPDTGRQLWTHEMGDFGGNPVTTALTDGERAYLTGPVKCVALDMGRLATDDDALLWEQYVAGPQCSTPVLTAGSLFMVSEGGMGHCLDARTGQVRWRHRLKGRYYASVVAMGDCVYFTNTQGQTTVVAAETTFRELGRNDLQEGVSASIAPFDDDVLIRTRTHLWRVRGQRLRELKGG